MHKIAIRVASTASIGACSFAYLNGRARWYLTGIETLRDLLRLLRTVEPRAWPVRPRGRGTSGSGSRRPRTGG